MGSIPDDLAAALETVAQADRLLVASDFDGVLAPFVVDPMSARAQEGTLEALRSVAALPRTHAALVSGRDLDTLSTLTGMTSEVTMLGSHGAQSSRALSDLDGASQDRLDRLTAWVGAEVARRAPTIRVEIKPTAVVLHTRGLDEAHVAAAAEIADDAGERDGVRLLHGKHVHELTVVVADKGSALLSLADELGSDALVYLGDDVTDEHVFEIARTHDVTIKVGEGVTAARHRVETCEDVPDVLAEVLRLRSIAVQD